MGDFMENNNIPKKDINANSINTPQVKGPKLPPPPDFTHHNVNPDIPPITDQIKTGKSVRVVNRDPTEIKREIKPTEPTIFEQNLEHEQVTKQPAEKLAEKPAGKQAENKKIKAFLWVILALAGVVAIYYLIKLYTTIDFAEIVFG